MDGSGILYRGTIEILMILMAERHIDSNMTDDMILNWWPLTRFQKNGMSRDPGNMQLEMQSHFLF